MSSFQFRPFTRDDYPLMANWLRQPHVNQWWADDPSDEALEDMYGANIDGIDAAYVYVVERNGRPFGFAQTYALDAYPQYLAELAPLISAPPASGSIDYLIGELTDAYQGHGTKMLLAFVEFVRRKHPELRHLIVPTHAENRASWRVLEKIGFQRVAAGDLKPDNPDHSRQHFIYQLDL